MFLPSLVEAVASSAFKAQAEAQVGQLPIVPRFVGINGEEGLGNDAETFRRVNEWVRGRVSGCRDALRPAAKKAIPQSDLALTFSLRLR